MKIKIITITLLLLVIWGCSHQPAQLQQTPSRHYVVVDVTVSDLEQYDHFLALEKPILKQFNAYVAMDIRDEDQRHRYITVSFPSRDSVDAFVNSEQFQTILPLGKGSASSNIFHGKDFVNLATNQSFESSDLSR